jgi:hypothetical protein
MSYWVAHGYINGLLFLLFLTALPRLTLFIGMAIGVGFASWLTIPFGVSGVLAVPIVLVGWIAWLIVPRWLIAIIATLLYWSTNPILVLCAWITAYFALEVKKEMAKQRAARRKAEAEAQAQAEAEAEAEERQQSNARARQSRQGRRRATTPAREQAHQWWDILGVDPNASVDAIKSAYRNIAKETHPDLNKGKGNQEKFAKATEAYDKALAKRK